MKKLKMKLAIAAALLTSVFANAQTVDEIIAKNIDAMGGKEKLSAVNSVYMEVTMQAMGSESPTTITVLNGKATRTDFEMMGSKMVNVYTDKGGWQINPMAGSSAATPLPDDQYKAGEEQIYVSPLLDYASKGEKVELIGQEKMGDANTFKIKCTNKDSAETFYYIDATSFYIIGVEKTVSLMGQEMQLIINYSDFRKTDDGIVFPYANETNYGSQFSITSAVKKIEINKPVDPAIFEMPKQ